MNSERLRQKHELIRQHVPPEIIKKLNPHLLNIEQVLDWREDVPHREPHVFETLSGLDYVKQLYNSGDRGEDYGPDTWYLMRRILDLHDKGYVFVEKGLLKPEEHHLGSMLIASKVDPDPRVMEGIYYHVSDTLPDSIPLWIRIVRDLDRLATSGFTGANRMSVYLGFHRDEFEEAKEGGVSQEVLVNRRILGEFRYPNEPGYEVPAMRFFEGEVLPFLRKDEDRLSLAINTMETVRGRLVGNADLGIEPIMEPFRDDIFYKKVQHTNEVLDILRGKHNLHSEAGVL